MQCGFVFILPLVFVLTIYVIKGRSSERIMLDWDVYLDFVLPFCRRIMDFLLDQRRLFCNARNCGS